MAIWIVLNFTNAIIRASIMQMEENENCSSAPDKRLSSELNWAMPCLFGENSLMTALTSEQEENKRESIARSSAMNQVTSVPLSFAKRIELLTACGLIAGITPLSVRQRWNQITLDSVSSWLDGVDAE